MEKEEFKKLLIKNAEEIRMTLNEKQVNQFYNYMELLLEWNEKINLTAITKPEEIILKHFIDSMTIAEEIKDNTRVVDVGTGAGFPGIPLKIVKPNLQIVLLDSLNKRIHFLEEVIQKLQLEKIQAIHARVEEFGKNKKTRESFDVATSRAVANLSVLSEYMLPLVKVGGTCIMMKGPQIEEELAQSKKAINILGGEMKKINTFELPFTNLKRNIVILSKREQTPSKYPRKPGTPAKEPIQ